MTPSSLAPELSATFNLDSCCIISRTPFSNRLFGLLYNFSQSKVFVLRKWACFHSSNSVAYFSFIVFIMNFKLVGTNISLFIKRVHLHAFNRNDNSFIHRVAGYNACDNPSIVSFHELFTPPFQYQARALFEWSLLWQYLF